VASLLKEHLPQGFPLKEYVGLIETSIGKMVPIQTESDPLVIRAEPHNDLYVNREGFLNPIPAVADLRPVAPMEAYGDRKLYVHNMGHATAAYLGYQKYPNLEYIAEVLEDDHLLEQVRQTMGQSTSILLELHKGVFTREELDYHSEDLLSRFKNRALGDTLFRVGRDLPRKLNWEDRIMGVILRGEELGLPWDLIGKAYLAALSFKALDHNRERDKRDQQFLKELEGLPLREKLYKASRWSTSPHPQSLFDSIAEKFAALSSTH
jgi:mannitol-1-phosphate 5-dehydrogenase